MSDLKNEKKVIKKTAENLEDAPRRRGRPRKEENSAEQNKEVSAKSAKTQAKTQSKAQPKIKEEKPVKEINATPSKRGRKPKNEVLEEKALAQKTIKEKINTTDAEPEDKPKRGRPSKNKVVNKNFSEHKEDTISPTLNPMAHRRNNVNHQNNRQNRKPQNEARFNTRSHNQMQSSTEFREEKAYDTHSNKQLKRNSRQQRPRNIHKRPINSQPVAPASAFDNSSVIAAITGQANAYSFEDNYQNYSMNTDDAYSAQEAKARQGNRPQRQARKTQPKNGNKKSFQADYEEGASSLVSQIKAQNTPKAYDIMGEEAQLSLPTGGEYEAQYLPQAYTEEEFVKPARSAKNKKQVKKVEQNLKMYIAVQPDEQTEIALVDNKVIVEYFVEMTHQAKIRGNIYKGVVHNVDPNLQAAFINFGAAKNGFLQIDEIHPDYYISPHVPDKKYKFPLISKVLRPGQEVLVQVVKEPTGSKGAFLTTFISLAGRYLVLSPGQEQIGISRKVTKPEDRAYLREVLEEIDPGQDMGVIMRTAAVGIESELIHEDLDKLQKTWLDIVNKAGSAPALSLMHQEVDLPQRVVRDYMNDDVKEIWTDDESMATSMNNFTKELYPKKRKITKVHSDPRQSLWERFNLQEQIDEITSRQVQLPSGGQVVFDQTEALMAIDINSGKTQSRASFHTMVLQTNVEAAEAIARHLRLRDIGGQIVIDFIELKDRAAIREVEKAFREAMSPDRARYEIGNISSFGLLEVVRQRIGSSAISISSEPCPHCNGTGVRRNMEWQAQDALKEIARKARSEKSLKYVYTTDKELALYLLNTKRDRLIEIESQTSKHIEIIV